MYRILLVEDDRALAEAIQSQLESFGHEVLLVSDFEHVFERFTECAPQLVLLDIVLPFFNGYHWCQKIRTVSKVPIVFLSSASENMNIVMAMNMGGDDFVAKPVDPLVLAAKVSAVLRRTYEFGEEKSYLELRGALLDLSDSSLLYQGERIELTKNEFRILRCLLENRGKIVSREALMMSLWQNDIYVEENTLSVNVARLRKKLDGIGLTDVIETKMGSGYLLQ